MHRLQLPEDERQRFRPNGIHQYTSPCGWTMKVILVMEGLVDFFTERLEIFRPAFSSPEVRIFRIEQEPIPLRQTEEHGVEHVVQFYEEATVNAGMVNESSME